jgi:hypothetical protein
MAIEKGTKCFMFHFLIGRGKRNAKRNACLLGVDIGFENERFEYFLLANLDFKLFSKCMFFVWDGNHRL